jgi:hypothetical protein
MKAETLVCCIYKHEVCAKPVGWAFGPISRGGLFKGSALKKIGSIFIDGTLI